MSTLNKHGMLIQYFACIYTLAFGASLVDRRHYSSAVMCSNFRGTRLMLCLQDGAGTDTVSIPNETSPSNSLSIQIPSESLYKRRTISDLESAVIPLHMKTPFSDQNDQINKDNAVAKRPFDSISYNAGLGGGLTGRGFKNDGQ